MSVSVQELDNTVRAFFEGKGDVVRILTILSHGLLVMDFFLGLEANNNTAKASPADLDRSKLATISRLLKFPPIYDDATSGLWIAGSQICLHNSSSKTLMPGSPWATFSRRRHTPRPNVG
jgi:hypothetical protein